MSTKTNVEKLIAAKLLDPKELSREDSDLIDGLSHHEIDALISAGHTFQTRKGAPDKPVITF